MRAVVVLAWAAAIAGAVGSLAFVLYSFLHRPDNTVEAELAYEGLRVARALPLYVDPSVGAWDAGGPPSRYYVLYTPFWSWVVGGLASPTLASVHHVGRAVSVAAWLSLLGAPVVLAPRDGRRRAALAALVAASLFFLARNAPSATPDTFAAALACVGLLRVARRGRVDVLSAILLVAAPFAKPSCLGVLAGVALVHLAQRRAGWLRPVVAAASFAVALVALCHLASGGAWLVHIVRSTGQPLSGARWLDEQGSRVVLLGVPHLAVAFVAWRRRAPALLLVPLLTSVAWSSFSMAKLGSGAHYWLEPTAAALVTLAFLPPAREPARALPLVLARLAAATAAIVSAATSLPVYGRELSSYDAHDASLAALDRHCVREADEVVASTDIRVELALDGRFLVPTWQSSILARLGRFPIDAWRSDLHDRRLRWLVLEFDVATPLDARDRADAELTAYKVELRDIVEDDFVLDARIGDSFVYRRRGAVGAR